MVVAARAAERETEPDGRERLSLIEKIFDAVLLGDASAFAVDHVIAIESGGDALIERGVRQQIAGELLDREAIERHVRVHRVHHPVAPRPHRARAVPLITVRIGVTRGIEPIPNHPLAVTRTREKPVHDALVSGGGFVGEKRVHLRQRRRQAGEIERHATNQRFARRFGRGLEIFLLQPRENETVHVVPRPLVALHLRQLRPARRLESPVLAPHRALIYPTFEQGDLRGGEFAFRIRRRHQVIGVLSRDALNQLAHRAFARNHHGIFHTKRPLFRVQPQLRLARFLVRSVTVKTIVREDGQDVAGEIHLRRRGAQTARARQ